MSCNCGCGGCQTKTQGPLLTEGKVKSLLSEGLQYHIDKQIPLFETVYRIGSDKHLALIKEARKMYSRNVIDLCEDDEALIKTHLGEFALYEGESVPLDLPMLNEFSLPKFDVVKPIIDKFLGGVKKAGEKLLKTVKREGKQTLVLVKEIAEYVISGEKPSPAEQKKITEQLKDLGFLAFLGIAGNIPFSLFSLIYWIIDESDIADEFLKLNESKYDKEETIQQTIDRLKARIADPNDGGNVPFLIQKIKDLEKSLNEEEIEEAEFKGKDVSLNKPKRGGSKAYYVYVRDPKTKKIKKVSFGSGGLRAKIKNKEARNAFAARHNCKDKKDRTKAGYWSCNLPRYASALGLGANMNTFW
jgi:organic radical activating enzyme